MRFLTVFGIVASLAVLTVGAEAQSPNPPKLEGSAALNAMTGSTIVGNGQYGPVVMFIAADHTLDVFQKGKRSQDRWSDKGGRFCIEHESHCAKVMLFGTQGILDYDGDVFPFTVETGNQVGTYAAKG
jgi:hypothetical protein